MKDHRARGMACPDCKTGTMRAEGGCMTCQQCGYSKCESGL